MIVNCKLLIINFRGVMSPCVRIPDLGLTKPVFLLSSKPRRKQVVDRIFVRVHALNHIFCSKEGLPAADVPNASSATWPDKVDELEGE